MMHTSQQIEHERIVKEIIKYRRGVYEMGRMWKKRKREDIEDIEDIENIEARGR